MSESRPPPPRPTPREARGPDTRPIGAAVSVPTPAPSETNPRTTSPGPLPPPADTRIPTPPLGRPATHPSGIHIAPPPPSQPRPQTGPLAPQAYGPPPAGYGSQIVGPPPYQQSPNGRGTLPAINLSGISVTPQMPGVIPAASSSRPTTGTLPIGTGSFQGTSRIMVQYPQVGSKLVGTRGTYEVRNIIGSGEFGAVYECIGPFDQIYAVKMMRPSNRPYSEVHAEWAREVQRLFTLRHPNVVYMYDSFAHDHLFYLALEKCDHPLKVMLGAPMQEGLVLEMSRQLLAAVQFLHDNDVVHDDLHSGNVLIVHTDRPTVKISDFGISHELRGMAAVRPNIVHHAIMAPEILATGYTSRQSDLYQVGLLVYWMLTGEPAMMMDVPYQELVRQVAEGEPRQRAESLGTPLGHLIAKMLRRREAFRYTSAREVWEDMRALDVWKERDLFPAR